MGIIWCGGEEIDFPVRNNIGAYVGNGHRSAYARCSLHCLDSSAYFETPAWTPRSSLWFSCRYFFGDHRNVSRMFQLRNGANPVLEMKWPGDGTPYLGLWKPGAGAAFAVSSVGNGYYTIYKLDLCIEGMNAGAAGRVRMWIDGQLAFDYTGDLSHNGNTVVDRIRFITDTTYIFDAHYSEIIVADEDSRLFSLKTLAPKDDTGEAEAGANTFTAGTYAGVDEVTLSDADTVYSEVAGQDFKTNLTGMPAGNFIVKGVKVAGRFARGPDGIGDVRMGIRVGGADFLTGAYALSTTWAEKELLFQQNPATANRFTPDEINAMQLILKSGPAV